MEDQVFVYLSVVPGHNDKEAHCAAPVVIALLPGLQLTTCSLGLHEVDNSTGPADE